MVQGRDRKRTKLTPKQIVISHSYADFDAIASTVAVSKLFPEAIPILGSSYEAEVQRFTSIYKDYLNLVSIDEISFSDVERVYLVDTQNLSRIKPLFDEVKKRKIYISVFDHHPLEEEAIFSETVIKQYGSTTTILYEIMKDKDINLTQIEATLFLLGIYEDTGSLTFSSTTEMDLEACKYFLSKGGKLSIVSEYIYPALNDSQKKLFSQLLDSIETAEIKGIEIGICAVEAKNYVEGVSFLAHKIMETTDVDALFAILKFGKNAIIIGKSKDANLVNVGKIIEALGGSGHPQAASTFIQNCKDDLNTLTFAILREAKKNIKATRRVEDFMSTPVKVVSPSTPAEEALKLMLRYGYSGLPVVAYDRLVGIISRRDIGRISEEKLKKMAVSYYMSKNPLTIPPEISIKEAEKIMIEKDYGRLPVVKKKKIVGILTRSDLLRALYGIRKEENNYFEEEGANKKLNLNNLMKSILPPDVFEYLEFFGRLGDELKINVYLVGGCIRNLILGFESKDFDILIDRNFEEYVENLRRSEKFNNVKLIVNPKFNTAKIKVGENLIFDITLTRREYYEHPAALPAVSEGSLREDLFRRDFTMNTLASSLNRKNFGELIDYFNGYKDIEERKIKILHKLSFIEDPSRILRAVEYENKYGFMMDAETEESARNAMSMGIFERISKFRILSEFINLLNETIDDASLVIKRLNDLGALKMLSSNIKISKKLLSILKKADKLIKIIKPKEKYLPYLILMILDLPLEEILEILGRLKFSKKKIEKISNLKKNQKEIVEKLRNAKKNSQIAEILFNLSDEELIVIGSLLSQKDMEKVIKYRRELKPIKLELKGSEIENLAGLKRELLGKIIKRLLFMKYDGLINSKEDEMLSLESLKKEIANDKI